MTDQHSLKKRRGYTVSNYKTYHRLVLRKTRKIIYLRYVKILGYDEIRGAYTTDEENTSHFHNCLKKQYIFTNNSDSNKAFMDQTMKGK